MPMLLDRPIKREVTIAGEPYTLTLGPESVTIVRKGRRKGQCVTWASLVEGTPQLRLDLARSIEAVQAEMRPVKKAAGLSGGVNPVRRRASR